MRTNIELYREENIELEKKEDLLSQDYQTICGAMTYKGGSEWYFAVNSAAANKRHAARMPSGVRRPK